MSRSHEDYVRHCIALAETAKQNGNHPFAAILVYEGAIVLEAENTVVVDRDPTQHGEMNLIRKACQQFDYALLSQAILYASMEPCAMCSGAIYWAGINRVVYGCSAAKLAQVSGQRLAMPCRDIFAHGQRAVQVIGPLIEEEAIQPHLGFWNSGQVQGPGIYSQI
jgi:tRNA(Arg) A34 adenosine deaminase TadA